MGRVKAAVVVLLTAPFLMPAIRGTPVQSGWTRLRAVDPTLRILDDPRRLLEIAATYEAPPDPPTGLPCDRTLDTRLEALNRLLETQAAERRMARLSAGVGSGIDHRAIWLESDTPERVVLVATLSRNPDLPGRHPWFWQDQRKTDYEDYWSMDLLEFDRSGRLLSWSPYSGR